MNVQRFLKDFVRTSLFVPAICVFGAFAVLMVALSVPLFVITKILAISERFGGEDE